MNSNNWTVLCRNEDGTGIFCGNPPDWFAADPVDTVNIHFTSGWMYSKEMATRMTRIEALAVMKKLKSLEHTRMCSYKAFLLPPERHVSHIMDYYMYGGDEMEV